MTPLTLKSYQQAALDTLARFARAAQQKGAVRAFGELAGRPYNADAFGANMPCVCLRIPTGGGKTVMAAHALPTSRGRFYPDFVAELLDGRVAVLEFKGAHLLNDPYEIEKRQVGERWAQTSGGRAIFGWLTMERDGLTLAQQLDAALVSP